MARNESDREDLIREAVAFIERAELQVPGISEPVTIGFRADSAMSVYFGQDPVYQFDALGCLRRAYCDGFLYRSHHSVLARLERVRTESVTQLLRYDLTDAELSDFQQTMKRVLEQLLSSLNGQQVQILRQWPENTELFPKICRHVSQAISQSSVLSSSIRTRTNRA